MGARDITKFFKNNLTTVFLSSMALLSSSFNPIEFDQPINDTDLNDNDTSSIFIGPKSLEKITAEKERIHKLDSTYFSNVINENIDNKNFFQIVVANNKFSVLVADQDGNRLYSKNTDQKRNPASLTKLMSMYMVLDEIENGCLTWDSPITISKYAAGRYTSNGKMDNYRPKRNDVVSVIDLFTMVRDMSDNTASTGLVEDIFVNEKNFSDRANELAEKLGMSNTYFYESTGLGLKYYHNNRKYNETTVDDLAVLVDALKVMLVDHEEIIPKATYTPEGTKREIYNHGFDFIDANSLIVKTGYVRKSGYNIAIVEKPDISKASDISKQIFEQTIDNEYTIIVTGDLKRYVGPRGRRVLRRREFSKMLSETVDALVADERLLDETTIEFLQRNLDQQKVYGQLMTQPVFTPPYEPIKISTIVPAQN